MNNSLIHEITISIKYGDLSKVLAWNENNCIDVWNFHLCHFDIGNITLYNFIFYSEQDALIFGLKWKNSIDMNN